MTTRFDESILRSLRRISRAIDIHSRRLASNYQLTAPQLVCLRELAQAGAMVPSKLADKVSLSQATVTGILDRLEARSLVKRTRQTIDKRRVTVELTAEGEELVKQAPPPLQQSFADRLSELPGDMQETIDNVLRKVVEMMEAEELDAAPVLTAGLTSANSAAIADFLTPPGDEPSSS